MRDFPEPTEEETLSLLMSRNTGNNYIERDQEARFNWSASDNSTWFFVVTDFLECLGFTSAKSGKLALKVWIEFNLKNGRKFKVFGVWNGQYSTHIWILDPEKTVTALKGLGLE